MKLNTRLRIRKEFEMNLRFIFSKVWANGRLTVFDMLELLWKHLTSYQDSCLIPNSELRKLILGKKNKLPLFNLLMKLDLICLHPHDLTLSRGNHMLFIQPCMTRETHSSIWPLGCLSLTQKITLGDSNKASIFPEKSHFLRN